jgi:acyl-CoA-dependent ceramide synthase
MIFWLVMIIKLVVRVLRGESAEDTRSDDEDEECDVRLPIEVQVDAEKLQFSKRNSTSEKGSSSVFQAARGYNVSKEKKNYLDRIGCEQRISR